MNVKELKEAIKDLPDDMQVFIQKDSEGNGYSPLEGADPYCIYIPDSTWSGEICSTNYTAEEMEMTEKEWAKFKKKKKSLVLFPVN
jgi:hypothetical protein